MQLAEIVKKYDLFLIADEVYREFCYDGKEYISVMMRLHSFYYRLWRLGTASLLLGLVSLPGCSLIPTMQSTGAPMEDRTPGATAEPAPPEDQQPSDAESGVQVTPLGAPQQNARRAAAVQNPGGTWVAPSQKSPRSCVRGKNFPAPRSRTSPDRWSDRENGSS